MSNNKRFLAILNDKYIKSGYELTDSLSNCRLWQYKSSAKRFISSLKDSDLKPFACNENPEACKFYPSCMKQKQKNNLETCGLAEIQSNIDNIFIGTFELGLVGTEKVNFTKRAYCKKGKCLDGNK